MTMELLVVSQENVEQARRLARAMSAAAGFGAQEVAIVVLVASELASNLTRYARNGRIRLTEVTGPRGVGIRVESRDDGPGISNLSLAMADGHSTGGGMGSGLPAVRRLMDEFAIQSTATATVVTTTKWNARS